MGYLFPKPRRSINAAAPSVRPADGLPPLVIAGFVPAIHAVWLGMKDVDALGQA